MLLLLSSTNCFSQKKSLRDPDFTNDDFFLLKKGGFLNYIGTTSKYIVFNQSNLLNKADNLVYIDRATVNYEKSVSVEYRDKKHETENQFVAFDDRIIVISNEYNSETNLLSIMAMAYNEAGEVISPSTLLMTVENPKESRIEYSSKKLSANYFGISCRNSIDKKGKEAHLILGRFSADLSRKDFAEIKKEVEGLPEGKIYNVEFGLDDDNFGMGFFTEKLESKKIMPRTFMVHFNNKSELTYKQEIVVKDARIIDANFSILPTNRMVMAYYSYDDDDEVMGSTVYKYNVKTKTYDNVSLSDYDIETKKNFMSDRKSKKKTRGIDGLMYQEFATSGNGSIISVAEQYAVVTTSSYNAASKTYTSRTYYQPRSLLVDRFDSNGKKLTSTGIDRELGNKSAPIKTFTISKSKDNFGILYISDPRYMKKPDYKIINFKKDGYVHAYLTTFTKDNKFKVEQINYSDIAAARVRDSYDMNNNEVLFLQTEEIDFFKAFFQRKFKTRFAKFNYTSRMS